MMKYLAIFCAFSICAVSHARTGEVPLPHYVEHLTLEWLTTNTIAVMTGMATADDGSQTISLTTNVTLTTTASGDNGLDAGSIASNTWYYIFIAVTNELTVSVLSTNSAAPTGYEIYRRIGVVRAGSDKGVMKFQQIGDGSVRRYYYDSNAASTRIIQNGNSTVSAMIDAAAFVPPVSHQIVLRVSFETGSSGSTSDDVRIKPNGWNNDVIRQSAGVKSAEKISVLQTMPIGTDQKLEYNVSDSANKVSLFLKAYDDEL